MGTSERSERRTRVRRPRLLRVADAVSRAAFSVPDAREHLLPAGGARPLCGPRVVRIAHRFPSHDLSDEHGTRAGPWGPAARLYRRARKLVGLNLADRRRNARLFCGRVQRRNRRCADSRAAALRADMVASRAVSRNRRRLDRRRAADDRRRPSGRGDPGRLWRTARVPALRALRGGAATRTARRFAQRSSSLRSIYGCSAHDRALLALRRSARAPLPLLRSALPERRTRRSGFSRSHGRIAR